MTTSGYDHESEDAALRRHPDDILQIRTLLKRIETLERTVAHQQKAIDALTKPFPSPEEQRPYVDFRRARGAIPLRDGEPDATTVIRRIRDEGS